MPKLTLDRVPKYRKHRASGQAVVTLEGRDHYLGPYGTRASRHEYDRLIGEWLAGGRRLQSSADAPSDFTIVELLAQYWQFAQSYYVKHGKPTEEVDCIRAVMPILRELYGRQPATSFGPLALKSVRERMIAHGLARSTINSQIGRIRRIFRWAAAEELVPITVYQALASLPGLRKGRTSAREPQPVRPIDDATVEATVPFLPRVVADMVRFQRLTGCRPAEVCRLRPGDVDTSGEVWQYVPESHKTEHHGRERVIFIGPKAQEVLRPYLEREGTAYCFSPRESELLRNRSRREKRQSKMTPSQAQRQRNGNRSRAPKNHYSTDSYRRAIERAVRLANRHRQAAANVPLILVETWAPNRLRHAAATEIRRRFGLEAAQVTLGHASADVSQIYAERDLSKAAAIMRQVG